MKRFPIDGFMVGMVAAVVLAWLFPSPGAAGGWLYPEILTKAGVALIFFLHGAAQVDWDKLMPLAAPGDAWSVAPGRVTLFLPGGIGRSKLAERLVRLLPPNTARNLNTVEKLAEMAAQ